MLLVDLELVHEVRGEGHHGNEQRQPAQQRRDVPAIVRLAQAATHDARMTNVSPDALVTFQAMLGEDVFGSATRIARGENYTH